MWLVICDIKVGYLYMSKQATGLNIIENMVTKPQQLNLKFCLSKIQVRGGKGPGSHWCRNMVSYGGGITGEST